MATVASSNNDSNKESPANDCCLQTILQNPFSYIILLIIGFIYSIILVSMEWNSNCYGLSHTFTWKYYLLTSIVIFVIYHIYLIILSKRFCRKLLLKPIFGLIMYTFLGNAILCLFWCIYGFIDWSSLYFNNKCDNNHIIIGYCTILIIYCITCLILSVQQCFIGIHQYKKRIKHKKYIENEQTTLNKEEIKPRNDTENEEIPPPIQPNIEAQHSSINDDNDDFTVPDDKLKEFVEEYNYFDGLDFSRSNIYDASTSNIQNVQVTSPQNAANNASRLQLQSGMPALNELKSHTVRDDNKERLEVPPPLSRDSTANTSTSIGAKSFSNLFLGEAREMSSTMFINYKKDNSDDNLMCMVCLETFEPHDSIGKLMCNHMFHKQCIYHWLKKNATCPLCREDVQKFANVPFL